MISSAVTVKLICIFVFAYAKCWFSHDAAQMCWRAVNPQTQQQQKLSTLWHIQSFSSVPSIDSNQPWHPQVESDWLICTLKSMVNRWGCVGKVSYPYPSCLGRHNLCDLTRTQYTSFHWLLTNAHLNSVVEKECSKNFFIPNLNCRIFARTRNWTRNSLKLCWTHYQLICALDVQL